MSIVFAVIEAECPPPLTSGATIRGATIRLHGVRRMVGLVAGAQWAHDYECLCLMFVTLLA